MCEEPVHEYVNESRLYIDHLTVVPKDPLRYAEEEEDED